MKKSALLIVFMLLGLVTMQAQGNFRAGINGGLPIGDAGDIATFNITVDFSYLFEVSDQFEVGPAVGFSQNFGEDLGPFEVDDIQFLPIAAAARFYPSEEGLYFGADVGYAVGINDGNDGGFYYRPKVGYDFTEVIGVGVSYKGVAVTGGSFDVITLGVDFKF